MPYLTRYSWFILLAAALLAACDPNEPVPPAGGSFEFEEQSYPLPNGYLAEVPDIQQLYGENHFLYFMDGTMTREDGELDYINVDQAVFLFLKVPEGATGYGGYYGVDSSADYQLKQAEVAINFAEQNEQYYTLFDDRSEVTITQQSDGSFSVDFYLVSGDSLEVSGIYRGEIEELAY